MLPASALQSALSTLSVNLNPVAGTWARAVASDYLTGPPPGAAAGAPPAPLWPSGAPMAGARYTPKGGAPMLYLADTVYTAMAEVEGVVFVAGAPVLTGARPFTVLQVQTQLANVLDLTDQGVVSALGTSVQELTGHWRMDPSPPCPTHLLGATVAACAQYDGLLAPSARVPGAKVLVVLTEHLSRTKGTYCAVHEGGSLAHRIPP